MKQFAIYTALRIALFVACYAVLGSLYVLVFGSNGVLLVPLVAAAILSALLSYRLLRPQREAFALTVQQRAERASQRFEERRSREDVD